METLVWLVVFVTVALCVTDLLKIVITHYLYVESKKRGW